MKLKAKLLTSAWAANSTLLVLTDETGEALPNQVSAILKSSADGRQTVTVEFDVDDDCVELIPSR